MRTSSLTNELWLRIYLGISAMSFKSHGAGGGVNTMKLGVNSMVCNRLAHRSKAVTSPLSVLVVAVCKALA